MRKYLIIILVIVILSLGLFYIYNLDSVPAEISDFYNEFLSVYAEGTFADLDPYLHFELSQYRILIEDIFSNIYNYRIEKWEKINDDLWVARTYIETKQEPDGLICYHFVGEIDGQLRVMIGVYQVPQALSAGADLSRFIPSNALPPDVTFVDIG